MGEETKVDQAKLEPCGYCRRCAVHDDPGGCLEVERYEREVGLRGPYQPPTAIYDLPVFGWAWQNDARDVERP